MTDEYKFKSGDCIDCKGPCRGHQACVHPLNSGQCGLCTDTSHESHGFTEKEWAKAKKDAELAEKSPSG